jgi:hypothetical protein
MIREIEMMLERMWDKAADVRQAHPAARSDSMAWAANTSHRVSVEIDAVGLYGLTLPDAYGWVRFTSRERG